MCATSVAVDMLRGAWLQQSGLTNAILARDGLAIADLRSAVLVDTDLRGIRLQWGTSRIPIF